MTQEQFIYWLQGFLEISGRAPTPAEWQIIKDHLATVFHKVTPQYDYGGPVTVPYIYPNTTPAPFPGQPYEITCESTPGTGTITYSTSTGSEPMVIESGYAGPANHFIC